MGRGRQKAKQTKVARKLKYYSPETDYAQLERELSQQRNAELEDEYGEIPPAQDWDDYDSYK